MNPFEEMLKGMAGGGGGLPNFKEMAKKIRDQKIDEEMARLRKTAESCFPNDCHSSLIGKNYMANKFGYTVFPGNTGFIILRGVLNYSEIMELSRTVEGRKKLVQLELHRVNNLFYIEGWLSALEDLNEGKITAPAPGSVTDYQDVEEEEPEGAEQPEGRRPRAEKTADDDEDDDE